MALEARGKGMYYYRKRRIGDRVVSEYVGRGEAAALLAQLDAAEREQRQNQRAAETAERATWDAADREVAELTHLLATLTRGVLVANGFYQHKRHWRRRREHID